VVATEELRTRTDRKYLLTEEILKQVLSANQDRWVLENMAGIEKQHYETLYYDTPELSFFHAARRQRPVRSKVRVRSYIDTGDSFIEVKSHNARGETRKVRQAWNGSFADARSFLEASLPSKSGHVDVGHLDGGLVVSGPVVRGLVDRLVPTARTAYERVAFVLDDGGRMTVDRGLVVGNVDTMTHCLVADGSELVTVETKSPSLSPTAIDRFLWDVHLRPQSLSKYALAIASFRPDLACNRWSRSAQHLHPLAQKSR
jgi:hypothetical protein